MKPAVSLSQSAPTPKPAEAPLGEVQSRSSAYLELTKPRIVLMELITVGVGYLLGARGGAHLGTLALTLFGTALVAGGAGALNMYVERDRDARMLRTARRPLPSGRIKPIEALVFGTLLGILGTVILLLGAGWLPAAVAAAAFLLYIYFYTPLKPLSTLNTPAGAIPGALPPMIGWTAATGTLDAGAWVLFLIVFLWQFPHFLAIAWMCREDYERGGMRMLPGVDPTGAMTGRQATLHALTLIPAGLLPTLIGMAGSWYFFGALALGLYYLAASARFWMSASHVSARRLLLASILYLPAILLLLILNPAPA